MDISSSSERTSFLENSGIKLTKQYCQLNVDITKCIICQKHVNNVCVTSTLNGCEKIKNAANIRKDIVQKRIKRLNSNENFVYHVAKCYKIYVMQKTLNSICKKVTSFDEIQTMEAGEKKSILGKRVLRSEMSSSEVGSDIHPDYLLCVICGKERVTMDKKRIREKFRICEKNRAESLLKAAKHNCDDVFIRVAHIISVEGVLAANLYSHKHCMNNYIKSYERRNINYIDNSDMINTPLVSTKHALFQQVVEDIDHLLDLHYGFTVSEIRLYMISLNKNGEELNLLNRDVKIMLIKYYGDNIQFAKNPCRNASELFFSSKIQPSDLANKIKNLDIIRESGILLRNLLHHVDFGLNDKFCDAAEIKQSWENTALPDGLLTFFSSLFDIPKANLSKIQAYNNVNFDDNNGNEEKDEEEFEKSYKKLYTQLHCLFQIMTYHIHKGRKKTPLHAMVGQSVYGKTRSRMLITTLNRIGVSTSYNEVRNARNLLSSYAILASNTDGVPIPSHFNKDGFSIAAMDNSDYADNTSLSGTNSKHYTALVLFQDAKNINGNKPSISSTGLSKSSCHKVGNLPCQIVSSHPKPTVRPSLSENLLLRENCKLTLSDPNQASQKADKVEFIITLIRCGLPNLNHKAGDVPTWNGIHALVSTSNVSLMRVGFLPMIPKPVTDYATVRKALLNFQHVRKQLNQDTMPLFCDEGVFQLVTDLVLSEPSKFNDIYPMLGMFHYVKVLLRCCGRLISGSGLDDSLIEGGIFGQKVVQSVLAGSHYVRAFKGMQIIGEVLNIMKWKAYWLAHLDNTDKEFLNSIHGIKTELGQKKRTPALSDRFVTAVSKSTNLYAHFQSFTAECEDKSELCRYLGMFQKILEVIKQMITADREGNWPLHVASVRASMKILRTFDCINYIRYASWYLERIEVLEVENPAIFQRFMMGQFVVQDHDKMFFSAVAPDMKLEQTINRSEKGPGGHVLVGSSGDASIVTEFELLFHEITAISNLFNDVTNPGLMQHLESSSIHHELVGQKAAIFDRNVKQLLDYLLARSNPFLLTDIYVPLHNLVTKEMVLPDVKNKLLNAFEVAEQIYISYRRERFVLKTVKLSATISKLSLPLFNQQQIAKKEEKSNMPLVSMKQIATAMQNIEIAKERGKTSQQILCYDLIDYSPIFEGSVAYVRCTKPDKAQMITELTKIIEPAEYEYHPVSHMKTDVIVDFMSKVRQYPKICNFPNYGSLIKCVFAASKTVCESEYIHFVFDSYIELSLKEGERARRSEESGGCIDVIGMDATLPIVQQIEKFWASSKNKENLQKLTRLMALRDLTNIVLSAVVVNDEIIPAQVQTHLQSAIDLEVLTNWQEEADYRLISHIDWSVNRGCERIVVMSNDTDSIILILRYITLFMNKGLKELWVEFGTGEHRRMIPLHVLQEKLGEDICRILIKSHVLSGQDNVSKVGTKHAALSCQPLSLTNFAETDVLTEANVSVVEKYLVKIWAGSRSITKADSFDDYRYECYLNGKSISELPPTSAVIGGHISRSFYIIRNAVTLLESSKYVLDPLNFGWKKECSILAPDPCQHPIPPEMIVICQCTGKCNSNRCRCKLSRVSCVIFCHKQKGQISSCINKQNVNDL